MTDDSELIRRIYKAFNRRDIPTVLAMLDSEVNWYNWMNGGHEHGHEAVRAYWTKQWATIQPKVEPLQLTQRDDSTTSVEVQQIVCDLEGKVLLDETVRHVFRIENSLVIRFDIEQTSDVSATAHH